MAPATLTTAEERPTRPVPPVLGALLVGLSALEVLLVSALSLTVELLGGRPLTPYVAPQYWLDYDAGFVRRGLPGEVLRLLSGDRTPTYAAAKVFGVGLSLAAVLAMALLALLLARRVPHRWTALALAAAVVVGPLGLPLFARDLGRYDAVGVLVLVALAAVPWLRLPPVLVLLGAAALAAVAVASEEFLVVLVVPVALLAVWPTLRRHQVRRGWAAVVVLPSVVVAGLSALLPAPPAVLRSALAAARAAGVPPSVPLVPGQTDHDAVSRLAYGFVENVRTYYSILTPAGVAGTTLIWAAVYLVLVGLVWHLVGRSIRERVFVLLTCGGALAALALSVAGIDFRRWWTLAAVAVLCAVLQLTSDRHRPSRRVGPVVVLALAALGATGIMLQGMPAYWTVPWWRLR